jgi:hypothetical protein
MMRTERATAELAEQKRRRDFQRSQTLRRLNWARGRGLTVLSLASELSRQPNSILRDLTELADQGLAHEVGGEWVAGAGPARAPAPAPQDRVPTPDPRAAILEVLGDGRMFAAELKSAVWARCEGIPRREIGPAIDHMVTDGSLSNVRGLLSRPPTASPGQPARREASTTPLHSAPASSPLSRSPTSLPPSEESDVRIRRTPEEVDAAILAAARELGPCSLTEVADHARVSPSRVRHAEGLRFEPGEGRTVIVRAPAEPPPVEDEGTEPAPAPFPSAEPTSFEHALAGLLGVAGDAESAELLEKVRRLRAERDEFAEGLRRVQRCLDRSGIPAPDGEGVSYRLGILEGMLVGRFTAGASRPMREA